MKKFLILLLVIFFFVPAMQAQRKKIYFGDKSPKEIKKSQSLFIELLSSYDKKINFLQSENKKLQSEMDILSVQIDTLVSVSDSLLAKKRIQRIADRISANNSAISNYCYEVSRLEKARNNLTIAAASTQQTFISGAERNIQGIIDLYIVDKQMQGGGIKAYTPSIDTAVVANHWHNEVNVVVKGPGTFERSFFLSPNSSKVFHIEMLGEYEVVFQAAHNQQILPCRAALNKINYYKGGQFAFSAILPKNN